MSSRAYGAAHHTLAQHDRTYSTAEALLAVVKQGSPEADLECASGLAWRRVETRATRGLESTTTLMSAMRRSVSPSLLNAIASRHR